MGTSKHTENQLELIAETATQHDTVYELIQKSGFFSNLERDEIEMLAVWVKAYSAPTGTVILKEGDRKLCLCIVVDGEINILKQTNPADDHIKIAEIKPGASIGEMGVVDGQPLSATAVTSRDSTILIITREDFQNLMKKNSNLGVKVLLKIAEIISVRLRHTTGRLADILASNKD